MLGPLKRILIGQPLATAQAIHERLTKRVALAVFSSDALSSTAYATEEILLVLAVAASATGGDSFAYVLPISGAIAVLLWLVTLSYRQTIYAYPSGGGAYIVAKDNLGIGAGLTAGAALLVDYVLTVAVSAAAGIAAIVSAAQGTALAGLAEHRVALCLGAIVLLTLANLRGLRESGGLFAIPTYVFVFSFIGMIAWGLVHYLMNPGVVATPASEEIKLAEGYETQGLSLFLILAAFSNGCTALTGVEAISNGVPAFKKPESRNASITLLWMAGLLTIMFLGTSLLSQLYQVRPRENETAISQFARTIFSGNMMWAYYLVQGATAAILVLAANTSFADFPRLASLMARDGYLPRQFHDRGDRLVYSNGIVVLSLCAAVLVWAFKGDTSRLIPLYAVGVFLSFTLSQAGMVRHWWHGRPRPEGGPPPADPEPTAGALDSHAPVPAPVGRGWKGSMVLNALGATATTLVLVVFLLTKFVHGAWIVVVVVPVLVLMFSLIHRHYANVERQLALGPPQPLRRKRNIVIMPVWRVHRGVAVALEYAMSISQDIRAVYVEVEPEETEQIRQDWARLGTDVALTVVPSPYRSFLHALMDYINEVDAARKDEVLTVLLPEYVPTSWWQQLLHNSRTFLLKVVLLYRPGIVVTSVPYHLH